MGVVNLRKDEDVAKGKNEVNNGPQIQLDATTHRSLPKTLFYFETLYFPHVTGCTPRHAVMTHVKNIEVGTSPNK